jgi:hypothetical protein
MRQITWPCQALTLTLSCDAGRCASVDTKIAEDHVAQNAGRSVDLVSDIAARPFACSVMAQFIGCRIRPKAVNLPRKEASLFVCPITDAATFTQTDQGGATPVICRQPSQSPENGSALRDTGLSDAKVAWKRRLSLSGRWDYDIEAAIDGVRILAAVMKGATLDTAILECLRLSSPAQIIAVLQEDITRARCSPQAMPVFLALGSSKPEPTAYETRLTLNPTAVFPQCWHSVRVATAYPGSSSPSSGKTMLNALNCGIGDYR